MTESEVDISEFEADAIRPMCTIAIIREKLEPDQLAKLDAAMARKDIYGTRISDVLKTWGYTVKSDTVQRHRRGICTCPR